MVFPLKQILNGLFFLIFLITNMAVAIDSPIAPPAVEVVDERKVNLVTGQLSFDVPTLSIGGERGLTHSVSLYSDLWAEGSFYGFIDKYAGTAVYRQVTEKVTVFAYDNFRPVAYRVVEDQDEYDQSERLYVMRVYSAVGSQDFLVYKNGLVKNGVNLTPGYTYRPIGDQRHTLEEKDNRRLLVWTNEQGVQSTYVRFGSLEGGAAGTGGVLREIAYPNGFKIYVGSYGVSTNTGFLLKYSFDSGWRTTSEVTGINLAHEYCDLNVNSCSAVGNWPKASFEWPTNTPEVFKNGGLPASYYLLKIHDAHGGVTEAQYAPNDICVNTNGTLIQNCTENPPNGRRWQSRLESVKTPGSVEPDYEYSYKNLGQTGGASANDTQFFMISTRAGRIKTAAYRGWLRGYSLFVNFSQNPYNSENSVGDLWVQKSSNYPGTLKKVTSAKMGEYSYSEDLRKQITAYTPVKGLGPRQNYAYDGRGNLVSIVSGGLTVAQADFPDTCSANLDKACNKPIWTKDANGNQTDYTYHPESGQIATVTGPAVSINGESVRPRTTYTYEKLFAYYKKNSNSIERADDGIWLLASEFTCRTTNATETGCVGGDLDKVEKNYYYGPQSSGIANNLLLRGESVTAEGTSGVISTRVTCYGNDKYGNQVSTILPKGNSALTSCP